MKTFGNFTIAITLAASLSFASSALAAPINTSPFLSVDFNGSGGGAATSPTYTGFTGFGIANPAGATSQTRAIGSYSVAISLNTAATGSSLTSRDRGANMSAASDLLRDFALVLRDGAQGLGYSYLKIAVSGLAPNANYEFTGIAEDQNSASATTNREGFSAVVPNSTLTGGALSYQPATRRQTEVV